MAFKFDDFKIKMGEVEAPKFTGNVKSNQLAVNIGKQQQNANAYNQTVRGMGGPPPGTTFGPNSFNIPVNRELTQDERADLDHYSILENYIDDMERMMDENPDRFMQSFAKANAPGGGVATFGDKDAMILRRRLSDWGDRVLRARSKSQTTEKEFERIRQFAVPTLRDITVTRDPQTGETFPTIRSLFSNVRQSAQRGKDMIIKGAISQEYQSQDMDNDPLGVF